MEKIEFPLKSEWKKLAVRPAAEKEKLEALVINVFTEIEEDGDKAVLKYSKTFDKVSMESSAVNKADIENSASQLSEELQAAIQLAKKNIEGFHLAQKVEVQIIETTKGVLCWRENRAIDKV